MVCASVRISVHLGDHVCLSMSLGEQALRWCLYVGIHVTTCMRMHSWYVYTCILYIVYLCVCA